MVEIDYATAMNEDFVKLKREREQEVRGILATTLLVQVGLECILNLVERHAMDGRSNTRYGAEQLVKLMYTVNRTELKELNIKGYKEAYQVNSRTSLMGEITVYQSLALNTLMRLIKDELEERGFSVGLHFYNGSERPSGSYDIESIELNLKASGI